MNTKTMQSETIGQLGAALAIAQKQMNAALKDSQNPVFPSTYANLAAVWSAARRPLADNELSVIQTTDFTKKNHYLVTTLIHSRARRAKLRRWRRRGQLPRRSQVDGATMRHVKLVFIAWFIGIIGLILYWALFFPTKS